MNVKRTCHYCETPKCRCHYREGRKGRYYVSMRNTTRQSTVGEMRENFKNYFLEDDRTPAVWSISYTIIDPNYRAKGKKAPK